ncbi:MAG: glycosyltransferase, partial [Planctomycetota bacterium]
MRIVHYISEVTLLHGGTVRAVIDLCQALATRGHEMSLLAWNTADVPEQWSSDPSAPRVVPLEVPGGPIHRLSRANRARARSTLRDADVLHMHVVWDPLCLQLADLATQLSVSYAVTPHGMLDAWSMGQGRTKKRVYLAMGGRRLLERAAVVHCASEGEARESKTWFPRGRSAVVPLLVDPSPFARLPGPELARREMPEAFAGGPVLLFAGRLHRIKRLELLLDAAAR